MKTETHTYNAARNIISFTSSNESGTMGYDSKNRLTSYKGTAITYDADGNMSVGILGTAITSFQYDSANRLTSATGTTYQYDNEGNRIQSQTSEQTLTYVYDTTGSMSRMLMSKTQDGAITKYIYGNGLIAQENASGYYSYHYDFRGSTIALTNASGTVTDTYAYDTYGTVTKKTGTLTVLFLYNGRDGVVTDSNGFLYMRARYYSPQLKRFINADIVAGSIQESPTLNRYAYVNGNPISYVDPFGLSAEPGSNWGSWGHTALDILGFLPVVGAAFDGVNAIWYLFAGDLVNAGFSATAFLPIIGDAAGAGKLIQNATSKVGSQAAELFAKYGDDVAKWADDILGFAKKEGLEVALPDGGSLKLWGDSAGNTIQFAVDGHFKEVKDLSSTKITSNLGNIIAISPSNNHKVVSKNPGPKGTSNSSIDILDKSGNITTRRWYDAEGNAYRDIDITNHRNPKNHPEYPHEHIWEWINGKPERR